MPTVSVITPVYNGADFIDACIRNVILQDCSEVEHIIVDGGSTDGTVAIIREHAEKSPHIRWISEPDSGQSEAMNKGLAIARGDIIGVLNVDDYYESATLKTVVRYFTGLPEPSLLVGNCNVWSDDGSLFFVNRPRHLRLRQLLLGFELFPWPVNPSAYFYHKRLHDRIGLYNIEEHHVLDLDFIFRAVQAAHVTYVDELLGNYRLLKGTKTFADIETGQNIERSRRIRASHARNLDFCWRLLFPLYRYYWMVVHPRLKHYAECVEKGYVK